VCKKLSRPRITRSIADLRNQRRVVARESQSNRSHTIWSLNLGNASGTLPTWTCCGCKNPITPRDVPHHQWLLRSTLDLNNHYPPQTPSSSSMISTEDHVVRNSRPIVDTIRRLHPSTPRQLVEVHAGHERPTPRSARRDIGTDPTANRASRSTPARSIASAHTRVSPGTPGRNRFLPVLCRPRNGIELGGVALCLSSA
jgi:hypothetical protein